MSEGVDTTMAEQAVINEQLQSAQAELAKYKQAEADRVAEAEANKSKAMEDRIARIEAEKLELEKSFEKKLESVTMRASTAGTSDEGSEKLTKEAYESNKLNYDTLALKEMIPSAFQ